MSAVHIASGGDIEMDSTKSQLIYLAMALLYALNSDGSNEKQAESLKIWQFCSDSPSLFF
ncbi:hypothetical protein Csa_008918 [Cucumis sativus]|uniref:Uncharacterized protein n=1 Tax=Cucumis sativus TaxID=3659 RepID=A0A0A0KR36_CUCSA|nr:hypothetical protein Csa_008918 [Cucumis sativus]